MKGLVQRDVIQTSNIIKGCRNIIIHRCTLLHSYGQINSFIFTTVSYQVSSDDVTETCFVEVGNRGIELLSNNFSYC